MQALIRELERADIPRIREIETLSFTLPWSEGSIISEFENPLSHQLVLEENDEVIGYLFYWLVIDEAHLLNIAIHPDARGKGWARFLLHAMITHAKENGMKSILLEVRANNESAKRLYRSFGFVETGLISNYYKEDKQDAILMRKELEIE